MDGYLIMKTNIVDNQIKIATKTYFNKDKVIVPGNIYRKIVFKDNNNKTKIIRQYIDNSDNSIMKDIKENLKPKQRHLLSHIKDCKKINENNSSCECTLCIQEKIKRCPNSSLDCLCYCGSCDE